MVGSLIWCQSAEQSPLAVDTVLQSSESSPCCNKWLIKTYLSYFCILILTEVQTTTLCSQSLLEFKNFVLDSIFMLQTHATHGTSFWVPVPLVVLLHLECCSIHMFSQTIIFFFDCGYLVLFLPWQSVTHVNLLLQLQAESFQKTLDAHTSGIYKYSHHVSNLNPLWFSVFNFHVFLYLDLHSS